MTRYRYTCTAHSADFTQQHQETVTLDADDEWWALVRAQQEVLRRRPGCIQSRCVVVEVAVRSRLVVSRGFAEDAPEARAPTRRPSDVHTHVVY